MIKKFLWKLFIPVFLTASATVLPSSCTTDDPLIDSQAIALNSDRPISRSSDKSSFVDQATAEEVAKKFSSTLVEGEEEQQAKSISNTVTINNNDGLPVMYAVNFASDEGFVIVSASKATKPILAFSKVGCYSPDRVTSNFVRVMFERMSEVVTASFDYPSDSVKTYQSYWAALLPPEIPTKMMRRTNSSADYQTVLNRVLQEWYEIGYRAYPVQDWLAGTTAEYHYLQNLDKVLEELTYKVWWNNDATVAELSYIILRDNETKRSSSKYCTPITTKWHINEPYNAYVPDGYPLSSEAVALGQLLHYRKDPSIMPHSRSESNPLQNNNEIASYLYDVATKINTTFSSTYSTVPFNSLTNALSNIYKYDFTMPKPSESALISSIDSGSPVLVVGYDRNGKSDAWICSAYEEVSISREYYLMSPVGDLENGIYGPFEPQGQWNRYGESNFYFDDSKDDVYFCCFWDFNDLTQLYTNGLVFFGNVFKKHY